jgi:hypothetical protein
VSYLGFFDTDDFLVGRNASAFDARAYIEQYMETHSDCAMMSTPWIHIEPDEEDKKADPWVKRPHTPPFTDRLREKEVSVLRVAPKSIVNPAAIQSMMIHWARMYWGKYCPLSEGLWTIHARGPWHEDTVDIPHGIRGFEIAK